MADEALRVMDQALALQKVGCFALVLECVPAPIAAAVTKALHIPTIGIGAGTACSGQVTKGCSYRIPRLQISYSTNCFGDCVPWHP